MRTGVVISLEGGNVGSNLAQVLQRLMAGSYPLAMAPYTIKARETICGVLDAKGYPPPCTKMLELLQHLNPATKLDTLRPDDKVLLPNLSIHSYTASGNYAEDNPAQVEKKEAIQRNWQNLHPFALDKAGGTTWLAYKAYELYVPTPNDEVSAKIVGEMKGLLSANVLLNVLQANSPAQKTFSTEMPNSDEAESDCSKGAVGPIMYRDYANGDSDALQAIQEDTPTTTTIVPVFMIDTPLTASPNLYPAYGPEPAATPWRCKWETPFKKELHHATHLAGIIASQGKRFGFIGLAPSVKLIPFVWNVPDDSGVLRRSSSDRSINLANLIVANERNGEPLRVYLITSAFDPLPGEAASGMLQDANDRFQERLRKTIQTNHPLLIVSAGQDSGQAIDISPKSPFAPMDLGDLDNVVVVTACVECLHDKATLLSNAWYSSGDHKIVHIAAPGGDRLPGWISNNGISAANGTSQAAAYAAGVAASMIAAFPNVYTQARFVKQRLQATSWPLGLNSDGTINPDADKVAAGIVDPILARMNPSRHWLKVGSDWRHVRIKGFSTNVLPYRNTNGFDAHILAESVLRIASDGAGTTIYVDRYAEGTGAVGEVGRVGPLTLIGKASLIFCDQTTMDLSQVDDLILAVQGIQDNDCANPIK